MKKYRKTFIGSIIAFFIGTSCCWLTSLAIYLGGATVIGVLASYIENIQVLLLSLGVFLLVLSIFFYLKKRKGKVIKSE